MEFNNSFQVAKPIDEVWETMVDLERVIPCVPGAKVLERTDAGAVKAEVRIRLGSMSMNYSGPAEIVERDDAARRAVLHGRAREAGGQGNADARIEIELAEAGEATDVSIHSLVNVTGKAAQMGEGVIAGVTEGMIGEFAENLSQL
ncbi:MAG TPA: SRPBCC family protein [Solirubrobacterales bacterium]|nr:SRPBCC family protein [Solirubrobacterales bacterium]